MPWGGQFALAETGQFDRPLHLVIGLYILEYNEIKLGFRTNKYYTCIE
jgi:hypothetical protein